MKQSRAFSLIETLVSVAIGFCVAYLTQLLVFPIYGISLSHADNAAITAVFTAVSILRGYFVRRMFNLLGR